MGNIYNVVGQKIDLEKMLQTKDNKNSNEYDYIFNNSGKLLHVWSFYSSKDSKDICCESQDLYSDKLVDASFNPDSSYIILILENLNYEIADDILDKGIINDDNVFTLEENSFKNITSRGIEYIFSTETLSINGTGEEKLSSRSNDLFSNEENFLNYRFKLYIWNGVKITSKIKNQTLLNAYKITQNLNSSVGLLNILNYIADLKDIKNQVKTIKIKSTFLNKYVNNEIDEGIEDKSNSSSNVECLNNNSSKITNNLSPEERKNAMKYKNFKSIFMNGTGNYYSLFNDKFDHSMLKLPKKKSPKISLPSEHQSYDGDYQEEDEIDDVDYDLVLHENKIEKIDTEDKSTTINTESYKNKLNLNFLGSKQESSNVNDNKDKSTEDDIKNSNSSKAHTNSKILLIFKRF